MRTMRLLLCLAAALALIGGLCAQAPPNRPQPPAEKQQLPPDVQKPVEPPSLPVTTSAPTDAVTLVGCLQGGTEPNTFILSTVTIQPSVPPDASAATPPSAAPVPPAASDASDASKEARDSEKTSAGAATSGGDTITYILTAKPSIDLKAHVGHRVEVAGMLVKPQLSQGPETRPSELPRSEPGAAATGSKEMRKVEVTSLRHIAASCP